MEVDDTSDPDIEPVDLHLCHGKILVWNAQDVKTLREIHHIVGSLVGGLTRAPRQNTQMGLPLQLMAEEANVLLQYGAARLMSVRTHKPNAKDVAKFEEDRRMSFIKQKELWRTKQEQKKQELSHIIEIGRMSRKQRRAEKAMKKKLKQEAAKANFQKDVMKLKSLDQDTDKTNQNSPKKLTETEDKTSMFAQLEPTKSDDVGREDTIQQHHHQGKMQQQCEIKDPNQGQVLPQQTVSNALETTNSPTNDIVSCTKDNTSHPEDTSKSLGEDNTSNLTRSEEKGENTSHTESSHQVDHLHTSRQSEILTDDQGHVQGHVKEEDKQICVKQEQNKTTKNANQCNDQGCLIQLFTGTPNLREADCQIPEWNFPETTHDIMRCRVFQNFWEQGYYLTSGSKFGGDFLAYPGDPFLYHSFYVVVCLPYKKQISPLDIVAFGRMASNVKKTVVLCSVDETDEVVYTSVQWTGIS